MCQIFDSIYVIYSMKNIWCLIIEIGLSNIKKDLVFDLKEGHSMPKLYIYVYLTMKMDPDLYFFFLSFVLKQGIHTDLLKYSAKIQSC